MNRQCKNVVLAHLTQVVIWSIIFNLLSSSSICCRLWSTSYSHL